MFEMLYIYIFTIESFSDQRLNLRAESRRVHHLVLVHCVVSASWLHCSSARIFDTHVKHISYPSTAKNLPALATTPTCTTTATHAEAESSRHVGPHIVIYPKSKSRTTDNNDSKGDGRQEKEYMGAIVHAIVCSGGRSQNTGRDGISERRLQRAQREAH